MQLSYFAVNLAYSTWLKHVPLVDVLIIAAGFVLRVGAGVAVVEVERFSPWLYVVTTLFALYIGFGKRRAELTLLEGIPRPPAGAGGLQPAVPGSPDHGRVLHRRS